MPDEKDINEMRKEFPSNSRHAKAEEPEEEKKVKKVIHGTVIKKKKTLGRRLTDTFLGEDVDSVFSYIVHDVLVPAAKNTLSDMVSGGIEMLLFGDTKGSRTKRDRGISYVSYSNYYNSGERRDRERREISSRNRARHNFDEITLDSRGEAEEVLSHLVDLVEDYGMASVADLYDLVGVSSNFTDNKYGWTNLSNATVSRTRDGYLIDLPRAIPLE